MKRCTYIISSPMLFASLCLSAQTVSVPTAQPPPSAKWVTLGTAGGPILSAERSQPANLLSFGTQHWLVDCGDGALERLSSLGLQPTAIQAVFLSHLHLDHIAGLQGLIGLRWMQGARDPLTVYGPPGTDEIVSGIVHGLQHSAAIDSGPRALAPEQTVKVVIVQPGADIVEQTVHIRAVRNSHFDRASGVVHEDDPISLSYRFDLPGGAIGYTGDTGVSVAVTNLFRGVDLVVSEVIDLPSVIANLTGPTSPMPAQLLPALIEHLKTQHLTPQQAGAMADAAGAHRLVFTHLAINGKTQDISTAIRDQGRQTFHGDILVAHDLETFDLNHEARR